MLTVVIPTIGRSTLEAVVSSVCDQGVKNITLIVIDDSKIGMEQERIHQIAENKNYKFTYLRTSGMVGPAKARNLGIENVRTKWVAFADDDDPWTENRVKKQLSLMKELNLNASVLLDEKNAIHKLVWDGKKSPLFFLYERRGFLRGTRYIPFGTLIYKYEIYKNVRFSNQLNEREDLWFLHELFSCNSKIRQLPLAGCRVRKSKLRSARRPSFSDDVFWYRQLKLVNRKLATNFLIYVSIRNSLATLSIIKIFKMLKSL
jgi:glycosyltransferase involved in cell wall biosynthesis